MTAGTYVLPGLTTDVAWPGLSTGLLALRDALREVVGGAATAPGAAAAGAGPPAGGGAGGPGPQAEDDAAREEAAREEAARAAWAVVQRAQAGDSEAFGELYDRYVDMVYRYVYYRIGSHALAEDLTSETFLRALRRLSSFTWQGRDFGAWLTTIARNLVLDHAKSGRARLETTASEIAERDRPDESALGSPEEAALAAITSEALLAAVAQLGDEQRECVVLRFLQGLSVAETAEVMGKNDGAVKALQYRAVRSLARLLPADLAR